MDILQQKIQKPQINEHKRENLFSGPKVAPGVELWRMKKLHASQQKKIQEEQKQNEHGFIKDCCNIIWGLQRVFNHGQSTEKGQLLKRIKMVLDEFSGLFENRDIEIISFDGQSIENINRDEIQVQEYMIDDALDETIVSETIKPLVRQKTETIQQALVVIRGPKQ